MPPMPIEVLEYADPHAPYGLRGVGEAPDDLVRAGGRGGDPRGHRARPAPGADPARARDRDPMRLTARRPRPPSRSDRLAPADADRPGRGLPRRLRRPPAGAHRLRARRPGRARPAPPPMGAARAALGRARRPSPRRWPRSWAPTRPGSPRRGHCVLAKLDRRARRGPADRLRGRLRRPRRRRRGRATPSAAVPGRWPRGDRAAVTGAAVQAPRGGHPAPRAAHAGHGARRRARARAAARPGSGDAAQGDLGRAGPRHGRGSAAGWRRRTGWPPGGCGFEVQVETPQADPGRRRRRHRRPAACTRPRAGCTGLHYGTYDYSAALGDRRRAAGHGPPGRRPRQGGDAGGGGRHRRAAVATARPTCCPVGAPDEVHAAWALHARLVRRSPGARVLPGLGPAPGPAADPVRGHLRCSSAPGWPPRPAGCATTSAGASGARARRARHGPGAGRLPASAGCDCGAVSADEVGGAGRRRRAPVLDDLALRRV